MYDVIEKLINIDFNNRKIDHLYEAVRQQSKKPIIETIAEEICSISAGEYVFLSTGSITRTWVTPRIGETDGSLSTAVLAKRIREISSAIPIIITEHSLVDSVAQVVQAAGLSVVTAGVAGTSKGATRRKLGSLCASLYRGGCRSRGQSSYGHFFAKNAFLH